MWDNWSLKSEVLYAHFENDSVSYTTLLEGPRTSRFDHQDSVWISRIVELPLRRVRTARCQVLRKARVRSKGSGVTPGALSLFCGRADLFLQAWSTIETHIGAAQIARVAEITN